MAARAADRGPDRVEGAGEPAQLRLVRGVAQLLGAGQVQQPQLGGHHPAQAQQRQRVELHLEQRPRLGDGAGRAAGLVVDHADRGAVRPPRSTGRPGRRSRAAAAPTPARPRRAAPGPRVRAGAGLRGRSRRRAAARRSRASPRPADSRLVGRRPSSATGVGESGLVGGPGLAAEQRGGEPGVVGAQLRPRRRDERPSSLRRALLGRQQEQPLQHRVHQRAAGLRRAGHLGQPVDRAEAVEQRALLEVVGARRRERRATRDVRRRLGRRTGAGRPRGALRLRHGRHGRAGVRQFRPTGTSRPAARSVPEGAGYGDRDEPPPPDVRRRRPGPCRRCAGRRRCGVSRVRVVRRPRPERHPDADSGPERVRGRADHSGVRASSARRPRSRPRSRARPPRACRSPR